MNKTNKKLLAALLTLALFTVCAAGLAENAPSAEFDISGIGSVTVILRDNTEAHNPILGSKVTLYKVGEAYIEDYCLNFALTPDFAGSGVSLSDLSDKGLAKPLFEYAEANGIEGRTEEADAEGRIKFEELTVGLYLAAQRTEDTAPGFYQVEPFLVQLPMANPDGTGWLYDIVAEPKVPMLPPPPVEYFNLTIVKVWDTTDDPDRPSSITVQVLCDGEPYGEPFTLDEEDDWTRVLEHIEKEHSWTAKENTPKGYEDSYRYGEHTITLINTKKLIQTGQLNWPIPVLACAGGLLVALGLAVGMSRKKHDGKSVR